MRDAALTPASLSGRLLADVVDECWLAAALDRARRDATLSRWRAIHSRVSASSRHGRNIPVPPSDAVLNAMLGAAWWAEFDALNLTVRSVPRPADPLHCYGANLGGRAGDRVISEIEKLRPSLFAMAVQPLVVAIAGGNLLVHAFAGVRPVTLPGAVLGARRWTLTRHGDLIVAGDDGIPTVFAQPTCCIADGPSAALGSSDVAIGVGKRAGRGGRPAAYDWSAFEQQLFRTALRPDGIQNRAEAVAYMTAWCATHWEDQPDQRTIERKVQDVLPPELPVR